MIDSVSQRRRLETETPLDTFLLDARSAVWIALLILLPGLPAGFAFARKLAWSAASVPVLAFTVSVFSATLVALVSWYAGFGLATGILVHAVIVIIIDIAALLWSRGSARFVWRWPGLVCVAAAAMLSTWEGTWFVANADSFYHLSATRSLLLADRLVVTDPFLGTDTMLADPTSGVIHTLLAMASKVSQLDVVFLFTGLAVLGTVVIISGFWTLSERFSKSTRATVLATLTFAIGGLLLDFRTFAYPNKMTMALMLVVIAAVFEVVTRRKAVALVLAGMAAAAASASHLGWAQFLLVAIAFIVGFQTLYALVGRKGEPIHWGVTVRAALGVIALFAAALAPLAPKLWMITGGRLGSALISSSAGLGAGSGVYRINNVAIAFHADSLMQGGNAVFLAATILAAVMLWQGFRTHDRGWVLGGTIGMMPALIGFFPPITVPFAAYSLYAAWRVLGLAAFAAYVPLSWGLTEAKRWGWLLVAAAILAALPFIHGFFSGEELVDVVPGRINGQIQAVRTIHDVRAKSTAPALGRLRELLTSTEETPMIAARPLTGYVLAGLVPVHIVDPPDIHRPFVVSSDDAVERRRLVGRLLKPGTSTRLRELIIERYGIDYIAVWWEDGTMTRASLWADRGLLEPILNEGGITLYRVRPPEERFTPEPGRRY